MTDWKNRIIETAEMAVKDLKANPKNWRKHPQAQQNALAGVLDTVGWVQQVIWNRQTGHLRVELAAKRKEKTIPVNVVDLSPEEEAMILATFDPIAAMAEADRQMLAGLMQSIETEDEQIQALLESIARDEKIDLDGEPPEAPEPQVDRAAELQEQWQTARGQLWQCGDHRVLCGDSTNADDVARLMGGEMADLVLTDPPYGIGDTLSEKNDYDQYDDTPEGLKELISGFFPLAQRAAPCVVLTPGNGNHRLYPVPSWTMAWFTPAGAGSGPWGYCCWQPILCYGKDPKLTGGKGRHPDAIVHTERSEKLGHPCSKPINFWEWLVERTSEKGEAVLDPFLGSGTTMIACEQLGRRCFGLEISPAYVAVILQRWHDMTSRDPVLLET